ncbi:hypothetical protein [Bradyrhizobium sp. SZCCHNS1012]|uniref:hypothetical protein n=1 Tax=Bradyrhizobium sp. SZCCHNS1012 TaxID=3057297 RepID=UPI002916C87F|nr:hypothetical protein [Bradyrhizobium sp. SZCCHNS1012]
MGAAKPWFRYYVEALDDPKVQRLPDDQFKAWVNLLCVAGKNDGKIPSLADAAYGLRMAEAKAGQYIAKLAAAGLLDKDPCGYFVPHNWDERQYRADHSTERVRKHRAKKAAAAAASTVSGTPHPKQPETVDTEQHETVSGTPVEPFRETDQSRAEQSRTDIDDDDDARARAKRPSLISERANKLADEIAVIAGHDLAFVPPAWCGAAYRVQQWLDQGWQPELITSSVKEQAGRRRGRPVNSIQYFEAGIADHIARQTAPLPNVVALPAKTVEVTHDAPSSGLAAIQRLREKLGDVPAEHRLGSDGGAVLSLPPRSVREP